ncbi:MAG: hypothetical protein KF862_01425 [Chitinophagaceae bacterium]|nr:hypothetical protein [Chitinophagaceae bacterium]
MKRIIFCRSFRILLLLFFFVLFVNACKKELLKTNIPMPPETEGGQVTPVGDVQEAAVTATIGSSGGTLYSADGRLRLTIPAGAVAENVSFSIQRISNTNVAGLGQAYRLLPHDKNFPKPVAVSFVYDTPDFEGTSTDAVGIAYQDAKGIWQGAGAIHDPFAKTFSISTTHFSDWSLFTSFTLNPVSTALEPGETLTLSVVNFMSDEDIIPPVSGVVKPIGPQHSVTARYVKEWKLAGAGALQANGREAVYTAPAAVPAKNPIAVSVTLKGPGNAQYLLVSNIYIGAEGITFRIDNGPWLHGAIPLGVVSVNGIHNLDAAVVPVSGGASDAALSLKWTGYPSDGHVSWGKTLPWFLYQPPGNVAYQQFVVEGSNIIPSSGGIDFSHYTETPGGDIIGSFILEKAGKRVVTSTAVIWTPVKIEGFFKTKRSVF